MIASHPENVPEWTSNNKTGCWWPVQTSYDCLQGSLWGNECISMADLLVLTGKEFAASLHEFSLQFQNNLILTRLQTSDFPDCLIPWKCGEMFRRSQIQNLPAIHRCNWSLQKVWDWPQQKKNFMRKGLLDALKVLVAILNHPVIRSTIKLNRSNPKVAMLPIFGNRILRNKVAIHQIEIILSKRFNLAFLWGMTDTLRCLIPPEGSGRAWAANSMSLGSNRCFFIWVCLLSFTQNFGAALRRLNCIQTFSSGLDHRYPNLYEARLFVRKEIKTRKPSFHSNFLVLQKTKVAWLFTCHAAVLIKKID